jgi:FAD:protein FMN transferase
MVTGPHLFPFQAMGTACSFHIFAESEDVARNAVAFGAREVYRLEGKYSRYDPESYLSEINRMAAIGGSVVLDDETADLIDIAYAWHQASGGMFDITSGVLRRSWNFDAAVAPLQSEIEALLTVCGLAKTSWQRPVLAFPVAGVEIDLGGIVKEYAADRAASMLLAKGASSVLVELGGDIRVAGERPDGEPWQVGIRKPDNAGEPVAFVLLASGGLATSGDYERYFELDGKRYSHILNPMTGWPVEGMASVSVVAESCLMAGQAATFALLKGRLGPDWLDARGANYLAINNEGAAFGPLLD